MQYLYAALLILAAYLYGSFNWAIFITRRVSGKDIRQLGTKNPGTANVGRHLGKGWGALVYFLDLSKGFAPLIVGRVLLFPGVSAWEYAVLTFAGIAAIGGHCKPLYYRFRGGGGIVVAMAVFLFFIPVEFIASVFIGFGAAMTFRRRVQFAIGQWTPIMFVSLTPFLTLALNWAVRLPLSRYYSIGGHPWYVLAGVFLASFFILSMNLGFLKRRVEEIGGPDRQ